MYKSNISSSIFVLFLVTNLVSCAGHLSPYGGSPPPDEYNPERLASSPISLTPGAPGSVWLKDLEALARQGSGDPGELRPPLTFGDLTDIWGYRWSESRRDVEVFGAKGKGSVPPILLDQFVQALRVAPEGLIWMSLDPEDMEDLTAPHLVHGHPREMMDSRFFVPLIQADYFAKAMSLDLVPSILDGVYKRNERRIMACDFDPLESVSKPGVQNMYFCPDTQHVKIEYTETSEGFEVRFNRIPVRVLTGSPRVPEAFAGFTRDIGENFEKLKTQYPGVFHPLHNMYKLFYLGSCLLKEREFAPVELDYWFSEYPLAPYNTPEKLPGFKERTVARFCGGPSVEYRHQSLSYSMSGGVMMDFRHQRIQGRQNWERPTTSSLTGLFIHEQDRLALNSNGRFSLWQEGKTYEGTCALSSDGRIQLNFADGGVVDVWFYDDRVVDADNREWLRIRPSVSYIPIVSDLWFTQEWSPERGGEFNALHLTVLGNGRGLRPDLEGQSERLERLLDSGANVNERSRSLRLTPLHLTAFRGHEELTALLLRHGADISAEDYLGLTPLGYGALQGDVSVAELILSAAGGSSGEALTAASGKGGSDLLMPLHLAAWRGHTRMVEFLLSWGADADAPNERGNTPLAFAASEGHLEAAAVLVSEGASIDGAAEPEKAAIEGDALNQKGGYGGGEANLDPIDVFGITPLIRAAEGGHVNMVKFLVASGANVNIEAEQWNNVCALGRAARRGHMEIADVLLEAGADINAGIGRTWTPLHNAAYSNQASMAEWLLSKGADVNAVDKEGVTPLHLAAYYRKTETAEVLLAYGADIHALEQDGRTPLSTARWQENQGMVELLRRHGAKW